MSPFEAEPREGYAKVYGLDAAGRRCVVGHKYVGRAARGRLYPLAGAIYQNTRPLFVHAWEFREPLEGEHYLSGAIPEVYRAPADLGTPFFIMREATEAESRCSCCGQRLPVEGR